jgi:hypothetical protein
MERLHRDLYTGLKVTEAVRDKGQLEPGSTLPSWTSSFPVYSELLTFIEIGVMWLYCLMYMYI